LPSYGRYADFEVDMGSTASSDDASSDGTARPTPPADERAESAAHRIARLATRLLSARIAVVSTNLTGRSKIEAAVGIDAAAFARGLPLDDATLSHEHVLWVGDVSRDPHLAHHPLVTGAAHVRFYAGAPLRAADGRALGTLFVMDSAPRDAFGDDDAETLRDLAAMVAAHVDARQAVGQTAPVTGLANRFRLIQDVDAFIASDGDTPGLTMALVETSTAHEYSELIRVFGAACVDSFERSASRIIRHVLPASARLYHLSVGRFACVFTDEPEMLLDDLFASLYDAIATPTSCDGVPIAGSPAFGVAMYPRDAHNADELFRAAVTAVHDARERAQRWSTYDAAQDRAYRRAFAILTDLPKALASSGDPLEIHYQPKIDLSTGICTGAEALVRWTHADLGAIPPTEFVSLAERTELIHPLTEWVMGETFSQLATWRKGGVNLKVSINISMRDLERESFPEIVADLMQRHRVEPGWFELEVTESVLMENQKIARQQLDALERLGISIAIDDFGTGQSALAYLKHLPARVVKIDQVFVRSLTTDTNDQHIVASTIDLAHNLGCEVVAEGIETAEACYWLADHGCDFGQGYAISRPLAARAFIQWVEERRRRTVVADGVIVGNPAILSDPVIPGDPVILSEAKDPGRGGKPVDLDRPYTPEQRG
jgi:EAL domain-containing protein (putative c-di-GMP-specific phosphodiesterase class I)/GGDEF domain-containing protein